MVFYFKARPEAGDYTIYMGVDKHENEELIKYGFPEDIWQQVQQIDQTGSPRGLQFLINGKQAYITGYFHGYDCSNSNCKKTWTKFLYLFGIQWGGCVVMVMMDGGTCAKVAAATLLSDDNVAAHVLMADGCGWLSAVVRCSCLRRPVYDVRQANSTHGGSGSFSWQFMS